MDIIIGAGITGLTYAHFTTNPYAIIEADDHIGGLCNTIRQDGFVWDYSGHFFHFQHSEIAKLIQQHIKSDELLEIHKCTQIKYNNRMIDFPFQKNIYQLDNVEYNECLHDLLEENEIEGTSFKSMLYAKFGRAISEKFLIPYNEKLYATDLDRLDKDAMGRFFPNVNKEDILRDSCPQNKESYNESFYYPKNGAIQYVNAVAKDVSREAISLNERVVAIDMQKHEIQTSQRKIVYNHLISTIPLIDLARLAKVHFQEDAFTWNKVLVLNLGFDSPAMDKHNHWVYFPEKKFCFYRVGYYSNIIPSNRMSLYVEIGLDKEAEIDVCEMLKRVLHDLHEADVLSNQHLISWHSVIINPAYVHITKDCQKETKRIKSLLEKNDVYSIGRYGSWNYSSIEDNMIEAKQLAERLHKS